MRLLLVNPRGFCAGVRMAIDVVDRVLDLFPGETIYVYHEIVHNRHVVGRFRSRGVVFVEDVDDPPPGSILVFSAHGIPPAVRQRAAERGLHAIDATCPLVTKVHSEAVRYARQGYQILLIGHRNHQEVIGTTGEAPDATQVVETPDDIPHLTIRDPDRLVYLTQTTLSTDDAGVIIDALKRAFPNIKAPPSEDICYATTNRQHAVRLLAPECDLVLVVGSRNSSNSVRLTEIAENVGTPARLIDDASGLMDEWFTRATTVGRSGPTVVPNAPGAPTSQGRIRCHDDFTVLVTAGASAPEDLVAGVCRALVQRYGATIETRDVFDEDVEFALPGNLRRIMKDRAHPDADRRISVQKPVVTEALYGAVPLTIEGR
ncbi:MAG TPA: 4-hydroxy-3-methylbut-2-enyl diphosphate reductase [Phycisphaerales bacterium]|nr:4-hydroxy-3-methylbut-2-enyl diphosphate reductase [Phycisphaerales bacterium]